jgi:hypothetical protein
MYTIALIPCEQVFPCDFVCAFCGMCWPWSMLAGWSRRLRYCEPCLRFLDGLELPPCPL